MLHKYQTFKEAQNKLVERGYTSEYIFEKNELFDKNSGRKYDINELYIIEYHRFQSHDGSKENRIIFVLETVDGNRGQLILPSSRDKGIKVLRFMDKVRIKERPLNSNTNSKNPNTS